MQGTLQLENISPEQWGSYITQVFDHVAADARCAPILADIGKARFQIEIDDRPDLSYWEDYHGTTVSAHLGVRSECNVVASAKFQVYVDTLLRRMSLMEAAADEAWALRGDTEVLLRCANLLPYVMDAFAKVLRREYSSYNGKPL
jgi:hypothetical protein